jgi:lactoylglutathione lyase
MFARSFIKLSIPLTTSLQQQRVVVRRLVVPIINNSNNVINTRVADSCNLNHHHQAMNHFSSSSSDVDDDKKKKPYKILGIQQIAIGCAERQSLDVLWKDVFNLPIHDTVTIEKENVIEDIVQLGPSPYTVEIDLMTPYDINKSPKVHIPSLNHIGLWVDNLVVAVDYMTNVAKVRFTPGGIRKGASGYDVIFIHPKGNDEYPICGNGVLIELVQAPQHVIDAHSTK